MKSKGPSPKSSLKTTDGLTSRSTKRTVKVVEFRDEPIDVDDPEPQTQTLEKMVDDIAKKLQNSEDEIIAINVSSDSLERDIQKNIQNLTK